MRLTCRPPERTKASAPPLPLYRHHQQLPGMAAIPTSIISPLPPSSPLPTTPVTLPPTSPQFFSSSSSAPPPAKPFRSVPRPSTNDILKRIVKADDGIKKKSRLPQSNGTDDHQPHFKRIKGTIVPPPPLSKYKRPPPIVPHRPGERYPLGMPYDPVAGLY